MPVLAGILDSASFRWSAKGPVAYIQLSEVSFVPGLTHWGVSVYRGLTAPAENGMNLEEEPFSLNGFRSSLRQRMLSVGPAAQTASPYGVPWWNLNTHPFTVRDQIELRWAF